MHDMLEEMGKDIVRQESKDPGKRSRLWSPTNVNQVLGYNKVNNSIEGIKLPTTRTGDLLILCLPNLGNILNLRYLHFHTGLLSMKEKLLADKVGSISLSNELRYFCWMFFPFTTLSPSFNPKNLVELKLQFGYMEQLWNEDNQELFNLREIDLRFCKRLRQIPNMSRAINLQSFICTGCASLVELPRLNLLTSLKKFEFEGCHKLKKFPELPHFFSRLDLSHTKIKEVPDSIHCLVGLRKLRLAYSKVETVSSNISKLESLRELDLSNCKRLKTLLNLSPNLFFLDAEGCSSLEKVSFARHIFNSFLSLYDGDDAPRAECIYLSFLNCRSLNQKSIKYIGENAMLQIESLAQRWARKKGIYQEDYRRDLFPNKLLFCVPLKEVSAYEYERIGLDFRLNLNLAPNGNSGSRFLAFAVCLVVNPRFEIKYFDLICKYQLTTTRDEKFTSEDQVLSTAKAETDPDMDLVLSTWEEETDPDMWHRFGHYDPCDDVLILFSKDMIIIDNDYESASFKFETNAGYKVKKYGVHVLYVDAESYTISDVMRCDILSQSFTSEEDSESFEKAHHHSATQTHGGPKRLKCFPGLSF